MQQVSQNVYVELGVRGCNVTLVATKAGVVMIDTPMIAADAAKLKSEIAKLGQLKYIINTEPHMDHFSGNGFFDVPVISHEGSREEVLKASINQYKEMLSRGSPGSTPNLEGFNFRAPTITLSQRLTFYLGDTTFKLVNMPGHSPFQVPVYIPEERVLCTSDNVVNGSLGFMHQSIPDAWLATLKQYEQLDVDVLVPGHGNPTNKAYLPEMAAMIHTVLDAVKDAIQQGLTLEQAQNQLTLTKLFPKYTQNQMMTPMMTQVLKMNIARVYELSKK